MRAWWNSVFEATSDEFMSFVAAATTESAVAVPSLCIDDWHRAMLLPIPDTVKYAKAVKRITTQQPNIYTAAAYNDFTTTCIALAAFPYIDAQEAYTKNTTADWREEFWCFVKILNLVSAAMSSYTIPDVPSRTHIRENIDAHRRESARPDEPQQTVTVTGAFGIALKTFAQAMPTTDLTNFISSDAGANSITIVTWGSMLTTAFEDATNDNDHAYMSAFDWPIFPPELTAGIRSAFAIGLNPSLFVNINQMNGFARVATHIPSNVMGQIEDYTAKLLRDVRNGTVNIRNLDLQKIGSEVLSNVSARDMSALSANIDGLIPILENASFRS